MSSIDNNNNNNNNNNNMDRMDVFEIKIITLHLLFWFTFMS